MIEGEPVRNKPFVAAFARDGLVVSATAGGKDEDDHVKAKRE